MYSLSHIPWTEVVCGTRGALHGYADTHRLLLYIKMRSMTDSRYGLHAYISKYIGREFLIIDTTRVGALAASFISYTIRNYLTATPQKTIFVITPGILI